MKTLMIIIKFIWYYIKKIISTIFTTIGIIILLCAYPFIDGCNEADNN
jgi:hypothetical protein